MGGGADHRRMALSAAVLHGSGGAMVVATAVLQTGETSIAVPITGAVALAAAVALTFGRRHLPMAAFHLAPDLGTLLIGVLLIADPGPSFVGYGSLYTFVAVYVCYWFPGRAAAAHLGLVVATCGTALLYRDGGVADLANFVMYSGAAIVSGSVVGWLAGQLRRAARIDTLTGVANRQAWEEDLAREAARGQRIGRSVSVLLIDLDGFKTVNDRGGHAAGDALLQEVSAAWQSVLRPSDSLARWGGDEFALVLPDCDPEGALDIAERLRGALPFGQTFSAGVARLEVGETIDALVRRADAALYKAKQGGRDCAILAPPAPQPG